MTKRTPLEILGETQDDNRRWWEENPMVYSEWGETPAELPESDPRFYRRIDDVFFTAAKHFAHPGDCQAPFSALMDFEAMKGKRVLEIGCGMGSHAELIARCGARYTGVDITERAVRITRKRFELFGLVGDIEQMDAERLTFPDESFDFVWSWGVIHHSHDTAAIVSQIHRVLVPGGLAQIMVYHKNSFCYYLYGGLYQGVLKGKLLKKSLYEVNKSFTDGAFAQHYTARESRRLFGRFSEVRTSVMDQAKEAWIPYLGSRARRVMPRVMARIDAWMLRRWGWFIFIEVRK